MKKKGFTLVELLISLVIFIGLSTLGIASYSYIVRKNEQQTIVDELRTAVQYAKIQAVIRGETISLGPSDSSFNWANGLQLTTWNKKTQTRELLYQWQWHHLRWSLTWNGVRSLNRVIFSNNPANAISNGHFTLENFDTHQQLVIILNRLGRIKLSIDPK